MIEGENETLELMRYVELIWRRLWLILLVFFATVMITLFASLKMTPIYEATTMLRIEQRSPKVMTSINEVTPMGAGDYASYKDYYETQYKLVKTHSLLKHVAESPLLKDYGLVKNSSDSWIQAVRDFFVPPAQEALTDPLEAALVKLQKNVKVRPVNNSQLVRISIEDPSPKLAVTIADLLADQYLKQNLERSVTATDTAARWLTNAVEEQKKKLQTAEITFLKYQEDHNINFTTQTTGSTSVEDIKSEYTKQQAQYDSLSERYTDEHPKMVELKSQLNSLKRKVEGVKQVDTGNKSVEYRVLEEEVQTNRRMYEALLGRFKEIDLSGSLNMNNITVIDKAELPVKPIKPNLKLNLLLALIGGYQRDFKVPFSGCYP
jgi:GumC protein